MRDRGMVHVIEMKVDEDGKLAGLYFLDMYPYDDRPIQTCDDIEPHWRKEARRKGLNPDEVERLLPRV